MIAVVIVLILIAVVSIFYLTQKREHFVSKKTADLSTTYFSNLNKNEVPKYTSYKKAVKDGDPITFMDYFNSWKNENSL